MIILLSHWYQEEVEYITKYIFCQRNTSTNQKMTLIVIQGGQTHRTQMAE